MHKIWDNLANNLRQGTRAQFLGLSRDSWYLCSHFHVIILLLYHSSYSSMYHLTPILLAPYHILKPFLLQSHKALQSPSTRPQTETSLYGRFRLPRVCNKSLSVVLHMASTTSFWWTINQW